MPVYTDQLGNTVDIPSPPQRIVSLVPSQTELLYTICEEDRVVGITKFCVHPDAWFRTKTRVGGTKSVKLDMIEKLNPDLIIANKEENEQSQIDELARRYPVWTSNVYNLETAREMILLVSKIIDTKNHSLISQIDAGFESLQPLQPLVRTCYLIWRNPYMTIGGDTFINDMLKRCGLENIFGDEKRYPQITVEMLREKNCELVILPSEPYPFKEQHIKELQQHLPGVKIVLADGEMFSWYGSRLVQAPRYFRELLKQI